ncbi:MAG: GIY-YIG nuclease family protein [Tissierellia bacterium]|nr:GIY-YIG nuclease family protein [Tissierellia bacterium]
MIIYIIKNKINGKVYIGQTIQTFQARMSEHRKKARNNANFPLYNAINKYGLKSFSFEVLDTANSQQELDEKEIAYIKKYNSLYPNGYNLTKGGAGTFDYKHKEETKMLMSKLKEGMYIGKNNPFYGKNHSKEQIEKWKKERKGTKLSEEHKRKISQTRRRKPIINLDTSEVFESARHVCRYYGKDPESGTAGAIANVCKKKPKYETCMGFRFEYYNPNIHDNTVPNIKFIDEGVTTIRKE